MPDQLQAVYEVETGKLTYMHSIDAAEAVRLGDYTMTPPKKDPDPQERANAMARAKGATVPVHAELQTPEEREELRRQANKAAGMEPPAPLRTPVVHEEPPKVEEPPKADAPHSARHGTSEKK